MAKSNKVGTGASIERDLVRRWARRKIAGYKSGMTYVQGMNELLSYLETQPKRVAKKKGGTGRK